MLRKIDLSGIVEWSEKDKQEVRKLIADYGFLFALDSLDLGKPSVVKHSIKHNDYTPFKERYRRIPPWQFEEERKHMQEMLDIEVIRKSNSSLASAVVLVWKKDGSLGFCIDFRKYNAHTIRGAYFCPE